MVGMPFFIFVSHFLQKHLVVSNSVRTFEPTKKHKVFIHNQNQIKMTNSINLLSKEEKAKLAAQMAIMDSIEKKGNIPTNEMIAFMSSETFMNAVKNYLEVIK